MVVLTFQSIVQYKIDTATGKIEVVKQFTHPISGTQTLKKKPVVPKTVSSKPLTESYF